MNPETPESNASPLPVETATPPPPPPDDTERVTRPAEGGKRARLKGRKRPAEEIARAKAATALTRQIEKDPTMLRALALRALKSTGGAGPAMVDALQKGMHDEFKIAFSPAAVRAMLLRLERKGILRSRKEGRSYVWSEGKGRAALTPSSVREAHHRRRGRPPRAVSAPTGGDAADRLIRALAEAQRAATDLRNELVAVTRMRDELRELMRRLGKKKR
ncbi:MAG: BlaI/MecI/CopY family transcriptional regulator [Myxococcota bacterium]